MKKLLFGLVAVVAFGLNVNAKEIALTKEVSGKEKVVFTESEGDNNVKISIHFKWGRISRDCKGFGICDFYIDVDVPLDGVKFYATTNSTGNLELEVTKLGMESVKNTFGGNTIILEEDFTVSSEACKQIGLKEGYTVKAGKYTVTTNRLGVSYVIL